LTALNHPYRQRQSGGAQLVATREDQVIALSLLQPKSLPETMLTVHLRRIYTDLLEAFYGEEFTVGTAMRKLRLPRSNVRRYVVALEHCGLLDRIGGNKRSGYRYVVIDWPWLDRSKG
jgi:response regulator of citrate/malate metabolism